MIRRIITINIGLLIILISFVLSAPTENSIIMLIGGSIGAMISLPAIIGVKE